MPLMKGTRLGPYEISAPIGAGGMGEVYRAIDRKLKRDVAIKTLAGVVAGDRSRLARLEQEARVLASLNHPHIASIYGLEELEGVPCLVLELVEGQTLAERLSRGGLPAETVLDFGRQIALALEAAHEKGIIHRDLKPGNIKVTPEGKVKVLDFGLAKILEPEAAPHAVPEEASHLTTAGLPATREGAILGTLPYMSPEQVRGERLDFRTDIWSYGCVLYEMVTGGRAFSGRTPAELGAAILEREPAWDGLRGGCSAEIGRLIRRCLRKDPRRRLHDIADARIEIEEAQEGTTGGAGALPAPDGTRRWRGRSLWPLAGLLAAALLVILAQGLGNAPAPPAPPILRASLTLPGGPAPADTAVPSVVVSPDGRTVVFRARGRLHRRAFDGTAALPIPGSEGGWAPSFSPDGEWLAFFSGMHLLKIPIAGGTPINLCDLPPVGSGTAWAPDGRVIFARSFNGPLYVVPAGAGEPQRLTHLEPDEHAHLYPQALPGGRLLFTALVGRDFQDVTSARVMVLDLETGVRRVALEGATLARYVGEGWMMFVRGKSVFAVPFDLGKLQATGSPIELAETFAMDPRGTAQFGVSRDGTLVYVSGPAPEKTSTEVLSLDRNGRETPLAVPPGSYDFPTLSPDGRRVALGRCEAYRCTIVVFDRDRQLLSSVVPEPGRFFGPTWSPDGRRLALASVFHGDPRLVIRAADGSGSIESPTPPTDDGEVPNSWSPDGRTIAYTVIYTADRGGSRRRFTSDIWLTSPDGSIPPRPWMETPHSESGARFSPDGGYLAYVSDESGKNEVYLRPTAGQDKFQISSQGGIEPVWTGGGREVLFRKGDTIFAVDLGPGPAIRPSRPRQLLAGRFDSGWGRVDLHHQWDMPSDGREILVVRTTSPPEPARQLLVVTGWLASLTQARGGDR